jgi:hypothetical protein
MRESNVTNGRKIEMGHNKSRKEFRSENNGIEERIKRNIIISCGRRSLSERSLTNGISNQLGSSSHNILKKAFLNAIEADRIEDVGLHPTRWRLAAVTS